MEAASEGEDQNQNQNNDNNNNNNNNNVNNNNSNSNSKFNNNSSEGQSKPKRQMKTPFQLETLEKAYAMETYPSEATRVELSEKLGLSDRQLQMWFCHRRLKDKKDVSAKRPRKTASAAVAAVLPESPVDELRGGGGGGDPGSDYGSGSGSGSGSSPLGRSEFRNAGGSRSVLDDVPIMRTYYEPPQSILELRAITCVEAQLGEPLRDDGPILGIEFDQLPPDAFGAPIAISEQQKRMGHPYEGKLYEQRAVKSYKATTRALHEYPFLQDQPGVRSDTFGQVAHSQFHDPMVDAPTARTSSFVHGNEQLPRVHGSQGHISRVRIFPKQDKQALALPSPPRDDERVPQRDSLTNVRVNSQFGDHPIIGPEDSYVLSDGHISHADAILRMEKKRKNEEARIAKEVEAHEIRIRKELEKQDILRRKSEERMRKEMEKQDRERRKEEERLLREKQREEERSKREQKREMERREKFLQKEYLRAEKRKQKEELRKEREAVRRKAAIEKATARKIARESMELIEDEQLELMELAVASKGLSSMINLDHDTLQNIESFRDLLSAFPPKSLKLKKPFAVQPWINSEENIGNLLMVWRFLITFVDVLKLWPFTLDEFVQAFHDYDSRLLGEIHVALLKLIIKDIEDVARTPSTGLGVNQNGAANPGGGHPHIVEGAYAWGFDIRNWQRHLNPLTWPEIFRQLALSTGFGPRLKKRSVKWSYLHENDEGKGCEDIVSTLRNGSAAENAFAVMQEKGLLLPRRSRHRLTPGTVKFAAFHVLSLEGGKGLTVLELADKIQKSGLRDLTTSKTPEASISVALTRDAKLFERIAPSTYRVRSAFRKDPADAEAILSAARKKIQIFENGFLAEEDAEDVERDDAEDVLRDDTEDVLRDEESECDDVDEDPDVDDFATPSTGNKTSNPYSEVITCSGSGKDNPCNNVALNLQNELEKDFSSIPSNGPKDENCPSAATEQRVAGIDISAGNLDQENMEIDESKSGESWIQGLTEGDYSDLSVEERLNALVALIGIANEGNSIRGVLEDRMESANALKKQMWAEAQLDKSRLKEEIISKADFPSSITGSRAEMQFMSSAVEGSQSPLLNVDNQNNEGSPSTAENQNPLGSQGVQDLLNNVPTERTSVQDFPTGPDNFLIQQLGYASKRSRSQLKSYIAHRAEEMYVYRSLPLGQDRRRNRYWQFVASASSNDPGSGRIFIELHDGNWRLIDSEEAFDALLMSLDARGIRESHLRLMLQKIESSFKENVRRNMQSANFVGRSGTTVKNEADAMDSSPDCPSGFDSPSSTVCGLNSDTLETSSSFRIELGRNETEKKAALNRYQDFQKWMWKECFNSVTLCAMKYGKKRCAELLGVCDFCLNSYLSEDPHCLSCHQNFGISNNDFNFSEHTIHCEEKRKLDTASFHILDSSLPLGTRLIKALLAFIEVSVPPEALQSYWMGDHRKTWGVRLNASSTVEDLLQILTLFERVLKRDFLSSTFATTEELLGSCTQSGSALHDFAHPRLVPVLPWIPQTIAAVALRLFELDASIIHLKQEKSEPCEDQEVREYIKLPSRYAPFDNVKEVELTEFNHDEHMKEKNSAELKSTRNSHKRGRGGREQGRGKRLQKKVRVSYSDAGRRNVKSNENLIQGLRQQGQKTYGQGSGRGRRTVRRRRVEKRAVDERLLSHRADTYRPKSIGESPSNLGEEWDGERISMHPNEGANFDDAEAVDSDDNAQAVEYEHGNWEIGFASASNGWRGGPMEVSDEDVDASEDDNDIEEAGDEDSEADVDMSEGSDGIENRVGNDEGTDSAESDDYSD